MRLKSFYAKTLTEAMHMIRETLGEDAVIVATREENGGKAVRVTAATTLVAFNWTNAALTFDQTLPAGEYMVVGGRFNSAGLLAWRCVFPGLPWRPGGIGVTSDGGPEGTIFRVGNFGAWGSFRHNTPPTIDFCSATADTSETGHLDLIKIS